LKEDGLPVSAFRTGVFLGLGKGRVMDDLWDDPGQFVDVMSDLVDVDTVVVGDLFVVTVPTGIQEMTVLLVLLWVQHVITFLTKLYSNEGRSLVSDRST